MDALCCGSAWLEAKMHVRRRKKVEGLQRGVSGAGWLPPLPTDVFPTCSDPRT